MIILVGYFNTDMQQITIERYDWKVIEQINCSILTFSLLHRAVLNLLDFKVPVRSKISRVTYYRSSIKISSLVLNLYLYYCAKLR